jgi:hypothetical protein
MKFSTSPFIMAAAAVLLPLFATSTLAAPKAKPPIISAIDSKALKAHMGKKVSVEGTCASWLCCWIDWENGEEGITSRALPDHVGLCLALAEDAEAWRSEIDELSAWSWGMAAEILRLYSESANTSEAALVDFVVSEIDEPDVVDRQAYSRHLFFSALAFIHGWTHQGLAEGAS